MSDDRNYGQLPMAGPLTGAEVISLNQNQVTSQTTTGAIAALANAGGRAILSTGPVSFSRSQLLNLFSSPLGILPAPGAGKAILIFQTFYVLTFGTVAYVSPGFANYLFYGTPGGQPADSGDNDVFTVGSSSATTSVGGLQGGTASLASVENQPIVFANPTANMTTGDGTGGLVAFYSVVDLS